MINAKENNIVLIGFMGSGKTVIGRQLARLLDYDFADTDEKIKEVTGMDLSQLYHKHGEIRFRSEERLVVKKLSQHTNTVIACGGSLIPQEDNLQLLHEHGWVVLLSADSSVINSRLRRKNTRLLINGKPKETDIASQLISWENTVIPYVDFQLNSGRMEVDDAAQLIADKYRETHQIK